MGRLATRMGRLGTVPLRGRYGLAQICPERGYTAPSARLIGTDFRRGNAVFIGEHVVIARWQGYVEAKAFGFRPLVAGAIELADHVRIEQGNSLEVFEGGSIRIGPETIVEPGCVFVALLEPILIGKRVVIGRGCAFFPYNHQMLPGSALYEQPLDSKGPITVEDNARLGSGVTVLSGVTIGQGAVVQAGSVVTRDVPAGALVAGSPARLIDTVVSVR